MKFGMRKPSLKRSLKARTTGKLKRSAKRAVVPGYGKKVWAGLKIHTRLRITQFITALHLG